MFIIQSKCFSISTPVLTALYFCTLGKCHERRRRKKELFKREKQTVDNLLESVCLIIEEGVSIREPARRICVPEKTIR